MKNKYHTLVIGSGAAGFNAADWLFDLGVKDIAIVTEGLNWGTSRNTGSDKQTYYKLSLAGQDADSVRQMAQTLFDGGSVHGDIALTEAACSVKCFMKLVHLGLPFPTNAFGEYVGYKTDHDPRQRATSCGPLTSKLMTEALERSVRGKNIALIDNTQVVKLLTDDEGVYGLAAYNTQKNEYKVYYCDNIILATGGPAGVYYNSVYPESQTGATSLALEAGAEGVNLQEWQYGLASTAFRWNVSGTYQQVLPRYISVSPDGVEREFLGEYFDNPFEALDMVFFKGYQWPFDARKITGSSRIDLLVHEESLKGNRIFMDFRRNPAALEGTQGFSRLSDETRAYLEKSGAMFGVPIERLAKMNPKAIDLYKNHGIDLYAQPLEVAVCAQHCNGGIAVDCHWQSSVPGLYVAGEAAGTFGVYRPGGSALNSTQAGSMRAAEHIAFSARVRVKPAPECSYVAPVFKKACRANSTQALLERQKKMSCFAAYIRSPQKIARLLDEFETERQSFFDNTCVANDCDIAFAHKSYDLLVTQIAVLSAMLLTCAEIGTRGSSLVEGAADGSFRCLDKVVITSLSASRLIPVRPLPPGDYWFETVWNEFNARRGL